MSETMAGSGESLLTLLSSSCDSDRLSPRFVHGSPLERRGFDPRTERGLGARDISRDAVPSSTRAALGESRHGLISVGFWVRTLMMLSIVGRRVASNCQQPRTTSALHQTSTIQCQPDNKQTRWFSSQHLATISCTKYFKAVSELTVRRHITSRASGTNQIDVSCIALHEVTAISTSRLLR